MNGNYSDERKSLLNSTDNLLITAHREDPVPFGWNTFKPFLFFGQRIPNLYRPGLYLHLFIVVLQYFFFINTQVIIDLVLQRSFSVFKNDFASPLLSSVSYLIIPFIVYFCDRQMISRYRLVFSFLLMAFIASCILLILLLLEHFEKDNIHNLTTNTHNNTSIDLVLGIFYGVEEIYCVLGYILFSVSYALSRPLSIAFGLDLLQGTHYETLLLYFPLFYISMNIGASFSYLVYIKFVKDPYLHCIVTTVIILLALLLTMFGKFRGYFQDHGIVANNFSFKKGLKLLFAAFKLKFFARKKADFRKLMLFTARKREYEDPHCLVDRTLAMVKINLILLTLIPLLGADQILNQLFPEQAYFLNFIPKPVTHPDNVKYYCDSENYFSSYWFVNNLTIVLFVPFIEYLFNDIIFECSRCEMPCWVSCISFGIKFIRTNCIHPFRKRLHKYLASVDPILKRIFWGLPFGLLSALCALIVEILQIQFPYELKCGEGKYYISTLVPLISQIPQYFFSGLLEAISTIGLLQYVYYLCSFHFKNSLKGFFFSLFYFYYGVAGVIANYFYFSLDEICANNCKPNFTSDTDISYSNYTNSWCLVANTDCTTSFMPNAWAIWVIVILIYLVMIPMFYIFSHWNHWSSIRRENIEREM